MNGVLVVRCECDHLCACHSQTKKFRAKSVAKTTTSSKRKKKRVDSKTWVAVETLCWDCFDCSVCLHGIYSLACDGYIHQWRHEAAHWTLQNRFKIYLVIVLSHRSKFSSIPFARFYFCPRSVCVSALNAVHETKKNMNWLLTAYYYSPVYKR